MFAPALPLAGTGSPSAKRDSLPRRPSSSCLSEPATAAQSAEIEASSSMTAAPAPTTAASLKRTFVPASELDLCSTFAGLSSPRTPSRRRRNLLGSEGACSPSPSSAGPHLSPARASGEPSAPAPPAPPPADAPLQACSSSSRSPEIESEIDAAASGSWKRKTPWQRVNVPVYALSTVDAFGKSNMNIASYVTAISVDPKMYAVSIFHGTKTLENARATGRILLQTLDAEEHYKLVNLLGKQSGREVDKMRDPLLAGATEQMNGIAYLRDALSVVELKVRQWVEAGDHELAVCDVVGWANLNDGRSLDMDDLRRHKIVRI
eukprot:tig00021435_g21436.t1